MNPGVVIIDSGGANLMSLRYAFERLDTRADVSSDGSRIASADRVVLPGVGNAAYAMRRLRDAQLIEVIRTLTQPVLGICLGMHLLFQRSAEGPTACLNLLPSAVESLIVLPGLPVPHMGWNQLRSLRSDPMLEGIKDGDHFYFVHRYAAPVTEHTLASSDYGVAIAAVVRHRNFWGVQFHPERSGATGSQMLANFLQVQPCW